MSDACPVRTGEGSSGRRIRSGRERPVTGFRGRSGRSFRARLALGQTEEGKWRVEFDEDWAREGAKPPEAEAQDAGELAAAQADGAAAGIDERSAA